MRFAPPGVTDEAMTYGMSKIEIFPPFRRFAYSRTRIDPMLRERFFRNQCGLRVLSDHSWCPPLILSFTDHQDTDKKAC